MDTKTLQQKVERLEVQVAELLIWKRQRMEQQLVFPLDLVSRQVINTL